MHGLFPPHVELPSSADFLMSSRKFGLSILRTAENPLQQQHLYAIFPIMVLFLIMSPPIAGLLMLFTLFPEWYRDRLLFAAAGRAFLWFWAGAALSFIAGGRGIDVYEQSGYLLRRWAYYDLPPLMAAAAGFVVWKAVRRKELYGRGLLHAALVYAVVISLFAGAAEAVIWFGHYDGYALFFQPLLIIARMVLIISLMLMVGHFNGWLRWALPGAAMLLFSLAGSAGPVMILRSYHVRAGGLVLVLFAVSFLLLRVMMKIAAPHYRRSAHTSADLSG
jgi:hypothetical protein